MDISIYFKSVVDSNCAPIVICNLEHKIIYMNPAAIQRYSKRGGSKLIGSSLLDCHNSESNEKFSRSLTGFAEIPATTESSHSITQRKTRTFIWSLSAAKQMSLSDTMKSMS